MKIILQYPFLVIILAASSMVICWEQQSFAQLPEPSDRTVTNPTGFLTYNNATFGVTIQYPSDWTQAHGVQEEAGAFTISSFRSPEQANGLLADVAIVIEYLDQDMTAEEYLDVTIDFYSRDPSTPDFQLLSSGVGDFTLAGMPAYSLVYTYTLEGWGPQRVLEVGTIVGGRAYYIEYLADSAVYQKYLPTAQEMISSFELTSSSDTSTTSTNTSPPTVNNDDRSNTTVTTFPEDQQEQQGEGWLRYENATYGVSMLYPSTWTQEDGELIENRYVRVSTFFSPEEGEEADTALVELAIDTAPTNLESSLDDTINAYSQDPYVRDFQVISFSMNNFTLAGMTAYTLEATYTDRDFGPQNLFVVEAIIDNQAYAVQYAADSPIYQKYLPTAQEMISSFELTSSSDTALEDDAAPATQSGFGGGDSFGLNQGNASIGTAGSDQTMVTQSGSSNNRSLGGNVTGTMGGATNMTTGGTEGGGSGVDRLAGILGGGK